MLEIINLFQFQTQSVSYDAATKEVTSLKITNILNMALSLTVNLQQLLKVGIIHLLHTSIMVEQA